MAKIFLADLHPIESTKIEKAFPILFGWVGWIRGCFTSDEVPSV
jgi:hypothetical protein